MTNAFQNFLNQEQKNLEGSSFNESSSDRYVPKNQILRLGKVKDATGNKVTKEGAYVRILPPVEQDSMNFAKGFRTTGINYAKKDGSQGFSGLTLPLKEGSSVIDPYIAGWIKDGVAFSMYPNKPGVRYFIHVVEYVQGQNGMQPKVDDQGNLFVQPMEITQTAYKSLVGKLGDPMMSPQGALHSFISENEAFLVRIQKAKKGEMSWGLDVYSHQPLGALPANWRDLTSDLEQLATPTEEQNPNFVNFLINNVNNTELSKDNFKFNRDTNTLGAEPTSQPTQDSIEGQLPDNLAPQAPVQQQPVQQAPQASQEPVQQQQAPQGNPFNGFDPSQMEAPQAPQAPSQPQQQPVQPQQPQQPQTQQAPPQQNSTPSSMGAIEDVLNGLDLDNL